MKPSLHNKQNSARRNACAKSIICQMPHTDTTVIGLSRSQKGIFSQRVASILLLTPHPSTADKANTPKTETTYERHGVINKKRYIYHKVNDVNFFRFYM